MIKIWKDLSLLGRIVVGIWAVCLIALIVFLVVRNNKDKEETSNDNNNSPEVAQVYEPSIGTPLPADVATSESGAKVSAEVENQGEVAGASTDKPFTVPTPTKTPEQIQSELEGSNNTMVAPNTGVNPNAPVPYQSTALKFSAQMPAGTQIIEQNNSVKFTSKTGVLYFQVSTSNAGTETLQSIETQLKNSSSVSNLTYGSMGSLQMLKYDTTGFGQGASIIANGKIYYLLGNSKYFTNFKI